MKLYVVSEETWDHYALMGIFEDGEVAQSYAAELLIKKDKEWEEMRTRIGYEYSCDHDYVYEVKEVELNKKRDW
jgi:hypothetical protein